MMLSVRQIRRDGVALDEGGELGEGAVGGLGSKRHALAVQAAEGAVPALAPPAAAAGLGRKPEVGVPLREHGGDLFEVVGVVGDGQRVHVPAPASRGRRRERAGAASRRTPPRTRRRTRHRPAHPAIGGPRPWAPRSWRPPAPCGPPVGDRGPRGSPGRRWSARRWWWPRRPGPRWRRPGRTRGRRRRDSARTSCSGSNRPGAMGSSRTEARNASRIGAEGGGPERRPGEQPLAQKPGPGGVAEGLVAVGADARGVGGAGVEHPAHRSRRRGPRPGAGAPPGGGSEGWTGAARPAAHRRAGRAWPDYAHPPSRTWCDRRQRCRSGHC